MTYYRWTVEAVDAECLELRGVKVRPEHVGLSTEPFGAA